MNKIKFISLAASVVLAMAFTFSCSSGDDNNGGGGGDSSSSSGGGQGGGGSSSSGGGDGGGNIVYGAPVTHGGETYQTVVIGTQTWFARNLNYNAAGSKCYDNASANCTTYGRLYDFETAKTACPTGFHTPTDAEWTTLRTFAGNNRLKAISGWNNNGNGTDYYGFSALPGSGNCSNNLSNVGDCGSWWTTTEDEYDSDFAYFRYMEYNDSGVGRYTRVKSNFYSVRCVKD